MITPEDIAILARGLCGAAADEPRIRCAVSRAYYAAFHLCQKAADSWCTPLRPDEERDKGAHIQLYTRLQGHSKVPELDKHLRLIAEQAKKLRDLRVVSDYKLGETITMPDLTRGLVHMDQVKKGFEDASDKAKKLGCL